MNNFLSEFIATTVLIFLGNGVVANVVLEKTKGQNSGWIVITFGWAMAVFVAVIIGGYSGAHLNPAVSIAMVVKGDLAMSQLPIYIIAQCLGAALGATLVWAIYKPHFDATSDAESKKAAFCTTPAIKHIASNLLTEILATFVMVFTILYFKQPEHSLGSLNALTVALLILAIGLCLGGTTGYALNPARDFMPRLMHFLLPIKNKANSTWGYSWLPVVGPIIGAVLAVMVFKLI